MKKVVLIISTILLISTGNLISQNLRSEYTQKIVGTWKVDSLEIGSFNLSPQYEEIVRQKMPEIIAMTEVRFMSNKKYFKQGFEGTTEGHWDISKDGQYIIVKSDGSSEVSRTKIISLTNDKLIMAPDDENAANSKAYLYKVQ
ncbi:MAG: lipocalin family protein [Bacteroidales bacterium]|nr:lipocalin family protein [Bacteroidales bacterium]MDD3859355.1 lipocalin family protein [Bacteroidales bacterium]